VTRPLTPSQKNSPIRTTRRRSRMRAIMGRSYCGGRREGSPVGSETGEQAGVQGRRRPGAAMPVVRGREIARRGWPRERGPLAPSATAGCARSGSSRQGAQRVARRSASTSPGGRGSASDDGSRNRRGSRSMSDATRPCGGNRLQQGPRRTTSFEGREERDRRAAAAGACFSS